MPQVDELLEVLGRARFISTLDMKKGYWQVPLSSESRKKIAFSTPIDTGGTVFTATIQ